jgi:hypothetical protein
MRIYSIFLLFVVQVWNIKFYQRLELVQIYSEIPLPPDGFYGLAVALGRQRALHMENSEFSLQLWFSTFPRSVAIWFYFLSETLILIASPIIYLFIHNHLTLRKWCYTPLQHNFPLDPMISSFHIHFGTFATWLWENYDYRNVSWETLCI